MPYLPTQDRNQMMFCSLDSFVAADSIARIIDVFIRSLNMDTLGFTKAVATVEGWPSFSFQHKGRGSIQSHPCR